MRTLHYNTYGDKNNQTLLLLHGFMGDASDWSSLVHKLQDSFYCIAIDLPGHGQSQLTDESNYTIDKTSESIIQLIQDNNLQSPHLLGYSMGGRVAFYLLTHFQEYFSKAILESSAPGLKTDQEKSERVQKDSLLIKRMQMMPIEQFLDDWYNLELFSSLDKNSDAFKKMITRKSKNKISELSLSLKYSGTGVMQSCWDLLDQIKSEILLITGNLDNKYTKIAQEIIIGHQNISHEIIDDVSHNVHFDNEELFAKLIKEFLK